MHRGLLLSLSLLVAACATAPSSPFVGIFAHYKNCRARYAEIDARIDAAGVRDAAYYRVPGYPYLRSDRLVASFRHEVASIDQVGGWLRRMRENDQEAREFEYVNLGLGTEEAANLRLDLLACGRGLAGIELDDPEKLQQLKEIMSPPDEAPTAGIAAPDEAIRARFNKPLKPGDAGMVLWQVTQRTDPQAPPPSFDVTVPDELGIPGLTDSAWTALAEKFAPALWMETAGADDAPGVPSWNGDDVMVDARQPQLHFQVNFTRFGGQIFGQITYFAWFQHADGPDGLMWRVTLDRHIQPVVYESLRASGAEHLWFPVQALTRRAPDSADDPPHFPQDGLAPAAVALRLASGTQQLERVLGKTQTPAARERRYDLRRYEDLFTLQRADSTSRSLFGADGLAHGPAAGAARQYGHHPVGHGGRRYFDDPFLLESVFVPPAQSAGAPAVSGS